MKAYIVASQRVIAPLGRPVSELPVHNVPLGEWQARCLEGLGCSVEWIEDLGQVRHFPAVVVFDDLYFTHAALARFLRAVRAGGVGANAQAALACSELTERFSGTFQGSPVTGDDGTPYRAYRCFSLRRMDPTRPVEDQTRPVPIRHRIAKVRTRVSRHFEPSGRFVVPACLVYMIPIQHWSALVTANLLGMPGFLWRPLQGRPGRLLGLLCRAVWRAGSLRPQRVLGKSYLAGPKCQVHPSAEVVGSLMADHVRIEANAVVRGSVLGSGACVGPGAFVEGCTLGKGVTVNAGAVIRCSVVGTGANIGSFYTQFSLVGPDSVMCPDSGVLDYQFHSSVQVRHQGRMLPSGCRLLGACLGERVFLGPGVKILAGREVPNDTVLVPHPRRLVRDADRGLPEHVIQLDPETGRPVRRMSPAGSGLEGAPRAVGRAA